MQNTKYVLAKRPFEAIKSFVDFISYNLGHVLRVSPHWGVGVTVWVWPTLLTLKWEPDLVGLLDRIKNPKQLRYLLSATHNCSSVSPVGIIIVIGLGLSGSRLTNSFLAVTGLSVCTGSTGARHSLLLWSELHTMSSIELYNGWTEGLFRQVIVAPINIIGQ